MFAVTKLISGVAAAAVTTIVGNVLCLAAPQPQVVVGLHDLLPNTPDQAIAISVSNVPAVAGLKVNAQVGNGLASGMPLISSVDLAAGTIFAANHATPLHEGGNTHFEAWSVATQSGTVGPDASGLLATIYLDTTGLDSGTYAFSLGSTLNGTTAFYNSGGDSVPIAITDGSITVVPEPTSLGFIGVGAMLLLRRRTAGK